MHIKYGYLVASGTLFHVLEWLLLLSNFQNGSGHIILSNYKRFLAKELDLESIGSSLGFDWELICAGLEWSGPDIRQGLYLYNRHLIIIDGHRGLRRW